jgi:D-3-phosphoglycerate dehydrogenase
MSENITLILDFDSTIVQVETLDELAKISLQKCSPDLKEATLNQIIALTNLGMDGTISIEESLDKRVALLNASKSDVEEVTKNLLDALSPSFKSNKDFFERNKKDIYIVSAGFTECIKPVAKYLGLNERNIFANEFIYDPDTAKVIGINKSLPLAQTKGKIKAVKSLNLTTTNIHALGDGFTDYEIKSEGAATCFFAYTETVKREKVIKKADYIVGNFDEYLQIRKSYLP